MKIDMSRLRPEDIIRKPRWRKPSARTVRIVCCTGTSPALYALGRALRRTNRAWWSDVVFDALGLAVGGAAVFVWLSWPSGRGDDCGCPPGVHGGKVVGMMVGCKECDWTAKVDDPDQAAAKGRYHAEFECPHRDLP